MTTKIGSRPHVAHTPKVDSEFVISPREQRKAARDHDTFERGVPSRAGVPVPSGDPTPNLTFHGGATLKNPVAMPIYYGSYWNTAQGQTDRTHNDAFTKDFGTSSMNGVLAQYNSGAATFGGSSVVAPKKTLKTVRDADVQKIVKAELAAGHVKPNAQGIYTVVLPPGVTLIAPGNVSSKQGLGGYHGSFKGTDGKPVYYAAIAYSDTKGNGINFNGNSEDAISITESHEWAEAATDPDVNSFDSSKKLGWYDENINGEIGDLAIDQLPLSQTWTRVDGFAQQLEWSNKDGQYEAATKTSGSKS